jgi:hypothetical protein
MIKAKCCINCINFTPDQHEPGGMCNLEHTSPGINGSLVGFVEDYDLCEEDFRWKSWSII